MMQLQIPWEQLSEYIRSRFNSQLISIQELETGQLIKQFGYGKPYKLKIARDGIEHYLVLNTIPPSKYGHQRMEDRAQILLWEFRAFNTLPKHARALDLGYFTPQLQLRSIADAHEFFIITQYLEGKPYAQELIELLSRAPNSQDRSRPRMLAEYLAQIHSIKLDNPELYFRRIRELLGHGECIFGICDGYPSQYWKLLQRIEKACLEWRWKLKQYAHRLSMVHGDFHPWNIILLDRDFRLLDRSRGEYGDPADDVSSLSINYIMFSLLKYLGFKHEFLELFNSFWERYLELTNDDQMLEVIPPFYCFRALVIASPEWYPQHPPQVRNQLLGLAYNLAHCSKLELDSIQEYLNPDPILNLIKA